MKPRKPQYSSSETRWKNVGGGRKRDGREAVEESQTRPSVRIRVVRQGREKPQRRCTKVEGWWKVETEVRHHHRHHQRQQRAAMLRKHGTSPWKAAIRENDTTRTGKMANVVLPVLLLIPPFPSLESFEFVVVGIECQLEESRGLLIKRGRWRVGGFGGWFFERGTMEVWQSLSGARWEFIQDIILGRGLFEFPREMKEFKEFGWFKYWKDWHLVKN